MMKMNRLTVAKRGLSLLLAALLTTSCTVGPEYRKPPLTMPDTFRSQISASDAASIADVPWWQVFNDEALQVLVREGLANNYDLKIAVARIEQARAMVGVAESEGQPQLGYGASGGGEQAIVPGKRSIDTVTYGVIGGLLSATWELDVWGRIKHATEAAQANLFAQEDVRRGVILTLVTDIAAGYFRLLALDEEAAIAEDSAKTYKKTLDLFSARYEFGRDNKLAVQRARAAYEASLADIQDLKRQIAQQENAISVLVGAYPRDITRGHPLDMQTTPPTPLGSTTALLQRRPEILAAEQNMIGANAEVGEAVADFFPRIGLSAFVGGQGVNIANGWQSFSLWNAALSLAGPIFSGGRLTAVYHQKQAYWDETVAQYKAKVLAAFHETADAIAAQQTLGGQRVALENRVKALQESSDLALLRYDSGRASYFEVLEAQNQLFPARDALARTRLDQLIAVVNLYKALGGGWGAEAGEHDEAPGGVINASTTGPAEGPSK